MTNTFTTYAPSAPCWNCGTMLVVVGATRGTEGMVLSVDYGTCGVCQEDNFCLWPSP